MATISLNKEALLYDIQNYSFVQGDIVETDNEHQRHQMIDICESGNIDRVLRMIQLAHASCVEKLYPYSKQEMADATSTLHNNIKECESYDISLNLPKDFSATTLELLKELIHEYIVSFVLADWMSIVCPANKPYWDEKVERAAYRMKTCCVSRIHGMRRKFKPF